MSIVPQNFGKAIGYAIVIWLCGFMWGTIVFAIPFLREIKPIPYLSSNPAISFPIIVIWIFLVTKFTKSYFKRVPNINHEALKLGLSFFILNAVLDLLVIVIAFGNGFQFYLSLSVWLAYAVLLVVPLKVGSGTRVSQANQVE
jgi:hypothetical protein